jgi:hypothetical protein
MKALIPQSDIISQIFFIRRKKVMLDFNLAMLYGVENRALKQQVKRNIERFPDDFTVELTKEELAKWRYQIGTSNCEIMGLRNMNRKTARELDSRLQKNPDYLISRYLLFCKRQAVFG